MFRRNIFQLVGTILALFLGSFSIASAQTVEDMWNAYAQHIGTLSPHINNCFTSEAFISIGGSSLGYCIEKDYRAAAVWTEARNNCATDGKRLPEPAEFKFACENPPSGLVNMTAGFQWASNHSIPLHDYDGTANSENEVVTLMGYSTCTNTNWGRVAQSLNYADSFHYRCVR